MSLIPPVSHLLVFEKHEKEKKGERKKAQAPAEARQIVTAPTGITDLFLYIW